MNFHCQDNSEFEKVKSKFNRLQGDLFPFFYFKDPRSYFEIEIQSVSFQSGEEDESQMFINKDEMVLEVVVHRRFSTIINHVVRKRCHSRLIYKIIYQFEQPKIFRYRETEIVGTKVEEELFDVKGGYQSTKYYDFPSAQSLDEFFRSEKNKKHLIVEL